MVTNLPQNPKPVTDNNDIDKLTPGTQVANTAPVNQNIQPTTPTTDQFAIPLPPDKKEGIGSLFKEGEPYLAEKRDFEPPAEVKEWVSEVKEAEEIDLPQPIKDDFGAILLESAMPSKPQIVLPLTQVKTKKGLHHKIADSVRWLAEWCFRLIKMFPKRVHYKELT